MAGAVGGVLTHGEGQEVWMTQEQPPSLHLYLACDAVHGTPVGPPLSVVVEAGLVVVELAFEQGTFMQSPSSNLLKSGVTQLQEAVVVDVVVVVVGGMSVVVVELVVVVVVELVEEPEPPPDNGGQRHVVVEVDVVVVVVVVVVVTGVPLVVVEVVEPSVVVELLQLDSVTVNVSPERVMIQ